MNYMVHGIMYTYFCLRAIKIKVSSNSDPPIRSFVIFLHIFLCRSIITKPNYREKTNCHPEIRWTSPHHNFQISDSRIPGEVHHLPSISTDAGRIYCKLLQHLQEAARGRMREHIRSQRRRDLPLLQLLCTFPKIRSTEIL